ncbi:MAG: NAD(P)H-hydrate epimerase [Planctomycetes bacterium]|nr:NAD(P)H-hydrate epimerase [Planctomycetota bacterium]NOG54566.1 NAD(P)H-hydrate epimerase [Planctomycetota bacterium]
MSRSSDESARTSLYVFQRAQIQALDKAAVEEYGIPGIVLMENAAHHVLEQALRMINGDETARSGKQTRSKRGPAAAPTTRDATVLICCGKGNNGGDGLALARLLHNDGVAVEILLTFDPEPLLNAQPAQMTEAQQNLLICSRMQLPMHILNKTIEPDQLEHTFKTVNLIVDALLGTGAASAPRPPLNQLIDWINGCRPAIPVLAVDIPSGLDCDTGRAPGVCINADVTVTFVGLKAGFFELDAQMHLGDIVVGEIGAPPELTGRFGQPVETDLDDALSENDSERAPATEQRRGKRPGRAE